MLDRVGTGPVATQLSGTVSVVTRSPMYMEYIIQFAVKQYEPRRQFANEELARPGYVGRHQCTYQVCVQGPSLTGIRDALLPFCLTHYLSAQSYLVAN